MANKKYITDTIEISIEIEGDLSDLIQELQDSQLTAEREGYKNLYIEKEYWQEGSCYALKGERLETDKEFERRKKKEAQKRAEDKKRKESQKERELKQYLKLKKKYGEIE